MSEALWLCIAALLALAGMAWLALAMGAHWDQVMSRPAAQAEGIRQILRIAGALGLLLSALACLAADRPSMAVLVWFMLLAAGAFLVAFTLSWQPALLRIFCPPALARR
jgi:hydrogenase-4 membrane subunit HyfE